MKFTIDRKTWYRGQGHHGSQLLREDGMRCCIGQVGQQCQIPDEAMFQKASIHGWNFETGAKVIKVRGAWPKWMKNEDQISECYLINDDTALDDAQREKDLIAQFASRGDELEFIN